MIFKICFEVSFYHHLNVYVCIDVSAYISRAHSKFGFKLMDRALTVGAASGSFTAIGFRVLSELLRSTPPHPECPGCPLCPELPEIPIIELPERLDLASILVGIAVGLSIGPLLDLLYLLRQTWRVWIRTRLGELARRNPEGLYRLA